MNTRPHKSHVKNLTKYEQMDDGAVQRLLSRHTLDRQGELLDTPEFRRRIAPELRRREQRRVARERARQLQQIESLRAPCRCRQCLKRGTKPFPAYYVVNRLSYECHLERQQIDPEIEEILAPLRNDRPRVGSAIIGRSARK